MSTELRVVSCELLQGTRKPAACRAHKLASEVDIRHKRCSFPSPPPTLSLFLPTEYGTYQTFKALPPSICLSMYIYIYIYPSLHLSMYVYMYVSIYLSIYLSIFLTLTARQMNKIRETPDDINLEHVRQRAFKELRQGLSG